jgi:hypothetical protein
MPNWITNDVEIKGSAEELKKLKNVLKISDNKFDFNGIIPMPEELQKYQSPVRIISDEEYLAQEEKKKQLIEESKVRKLNYQEEDSLTFSGGITKEIREGLITKYGVDNWYDWCVKNWGVKWNSKDVSVNEENNTTLYALFLTAWSTPFELFLVLSEQYPNLTIKVNYADEDFGYNVGTYTINNGNVIERVTPKGGSIEAIKLAIKTLGNAEYYLYDIFFDYESKEDFGCDDDYFMILLELSISEGYFNENLPEWVLDITLPILIEREEYELASKVRDILNKNLEN